jgi:hypothetical protein
VYLSYFVSPRGLLGSFLAVEGLVRLLHAATTGEPLGFFVPWLVRRVARRRRPPPPDRVVRHDDGSVTVLGAPRDWGPLTTFELDGRHYVLDRAVAAGALVRHELRPAPDNHLIRNLVRLGPDG